jgi:carbamoyltransferase
MPREFRLEDAHLGPGFPDTKIKSTLDDAGLEYEWIEDEQQLVDRTVGRVVEGDVVGWFQGRSEWGPRALGNRSIVVDPRRHDMKDILNERIKRREPFRPFAPSILEERSGEYFEESYPVPYMLQVYQVRPEKREEIPAVTHVDGSGRLQTVSRESNPLYHNLIRTFGVRTGTPVVLNTSFNENEPIVNVPEEAVDCFRRTRMDTLVVGKAFLRKKG